MMQPPLLPLQPITSGLGSGKFRLSREATLELYLYGVELLRDETVSEDGFEKFISVLRRLVAASSRTGGPTTALLLSVDPDTAGGLLVEPGRSPAAEVRKTWAAFADFIRRMVEPQAEAERRISSIEARFRPRPARGWYQAERVPGGHRRPSEGHRMLLQMVDSLAIRERAGAGKRGEHRLRDRSLVGLAMGSGLRWEEIVQCRWDQVSFDRNPEGKLFPISVGVQRRGEHIELPVHVHAAVDLAELYRLSRRVHDQLPEGALFRQLRYPYSPLSVRDAQAILARAASDAGCAGATLLDLRAAFADHLLSTYGVTELELTELLGYGEHKYVRQLIRHHKAWRLNREVDLAEKEASSESDNSWR